MASTSQLHSSLFGSEFLPTDSAPPFVQLRHLPSVDAESERVFLLVLHFLHRSQSTSLTTAVGLTRLQTLTCPLRLCPPRRRARAPRATRGSRLTTRWSSLASQLPHHHSHHQPRHRYLTTSIYRLTPRSASLAAQRNSSRFISPA